jgi:hypothetical protein
MVQADEVMVSGWAVDRIFVQTNSDVHALELDLP